MTIKLNCEALAAACASAGLSVKEMLKNANLSIAVQHQINKGGCVTVKTLGAIAAALNVDPAILIKQAVSGNQRSGRKKNPSPRQKQTAEGA